MVWRWDYPIWLAVGFNYPKSIRKFVLGHSVGLKLIVLRVLNRIPSFG